MYLLNDGTEVQKDQIIEAVAAGKARIVYGRGEGKTTEALMLDGVDIDTRGQCHSMWEEVWTAVPKSENAALKIAAYHYGK
ncbi:hypothetical protein [Herminiimonas sp. CN]|uniref:hypothetical protein n=1 Tax=Herminiimonas sp. CN TaxID=1349818 RepID=UPI0004739068|nr:hypothetical protein [Herminiimonas sp. CN]